ncbi:MAG: hypothetical protein SGI71_11030 [Verrucomicrobiota bacterium]|nr:hypothetical protein [Verrucomicrobiota bacterium]
MTTTFPCPVDKTFQFTTPIQSAPVGCYQVPVPGEIDRDGLAITKLGARGWGRLHHFRNYYNAGWGEGQGKPVSPKAVEAFYQFLALIEFPANIKPSIFLTDQGSLELCWENESGNDIQLEFSSTGIEYYIESNEQEGTLGLLEIAELPNRLR